MLTATLPADTREAAADVHLDSDALFVKNCCAIVHYHRRLVDDLLQQQQLLTKAAKMYRSVYSARCCLKPMKRFKQSDCFPSLVADFETFSNLFSSDFHLSCTFVDV